jgi:hypothetical protein
MWFETNGMHPILISDPTVGVKDRCSIDMQSVRRLSNRSVPVSGVFKFLRQYTTIFPFTDQYSL